MGTYYDHLESPSYIARIEGSTEPMVLLAHLDIVPAPEALFTVRQEGDTLFGRGVQDDKGPAAILLHVLAAMVAEAKRPTIELVLTTDEERGSEDGVQRLVQMGVFTNPQFVLALDGGAESKVVTAEKGIAHVTLEAVGVPVHNSRPWEGDNAIEKLWRCYERLKTSFAPITSTDDKHWHSTVSIGRIEGGKFVNQVPATATAEIDIRFTEVLTVARVQQLIADALEDGVTIARNSTGEAFVSAADHPFIVAYAETMNTVTTHPVGLVAEHGATDGRFFTEYNCPIILHYPDGGDIHTDSEWVSVASMERIYTGLVQFLRSVG